jgi:hypothetical protein
MTKHSDTQNLSLVGQVRCANCDIDILWLPTVVREKSYCCTGCAAGGPCNCDYSQYEGPGHNGTQASVIDMHVPMPGDEPAQR